MDDVQIVGDFSNGRLDVATAFVASALQTAAFDGTLPLLNNGFQRTLVLGNGIGVDERSNVVVFIRIANANLLVRLGQLVANLVVDAVDIRRRVEVQR